MVLPQIVIALLAGISVLLLLFLMFTWVKHRSLGKINKELFITWLLRNGVGFLKKPCMFLVNHIAPLNKFIESSVGLLREKNIIATKSSLASSFVFFVFCFGLFISLIFKSLIAGFAMILLSIICISTFYKASQDKRANKLRHSVPDTLRSMSTCFNAGYTIQQTFEQIGNEAKGAINKLFKQATHKLQIGGTIQEALDCLKTEKDAPELSFVAVALDVQHQTGGSIRPVLESAKDMVESKLDLLRKLQVQTSQAKLSARIVTILPFALVAIFSIISPNFLTPFFTSFIGICVFIVACVMQVAGVVLVRKMLKVEI